MIDLQAVTRAFTLRFGRPPAAISEAPGRVNLIGEHLDYNEGLVLPAAIDRSVLVAYGVREDATVRVYSLDFDDESSLKLDAPIARDEMHPWANYVRGVVWVVRGAGYEGRGLDLAVTGNVPLGAGLSSSAALEVATLGALRDAWEVDIDNQRLARLAQRAENEFVGVQCGIMDQFTAAFGVRDHALLIDCRSLEYEAVPLRLAEHDVAVVIVDSGLGRTLESSNFNARRLECIEALHLLRSVMPVPPRSLRDVSREDVDAVGSSLSPALLRRVRHVVSEMERVRRAVEALRCDDFEAVGRLMDASHVSLRDDFQVSTPELDRLVERARSVRGVLGSRLTGAGFGGCTVTLAVGAAIGSLEERMAETLSEFGTGGTTLLCHASEGLRLHRPEK